MFSGNSKYLLVFSFGLLLSMMIALSLIGLNNMASIQHRLQALVNEENVKTELVTTMRYIARERSLSLYRILFMDDPFQRDEELQRFHSLAQEFILARQKFEAMPLKSREKTAFAKALAAVRDSSAAQEKVVETIFSGRQPEAIRILSEEALRAQSYLLPAYNEIVSLQQKESAAEVQEASRAYQRNWVFALILGAAVISLGTIIAAWVIRAILRAEAALFQEKELAEVTLHSIADGVITTDVAGRIDYVNPIAEQLTGWRGEDARGLPLATVYKVIDEATRKPIESPAALGEIDGQVVSLVKHALLSRDGREFSVEDSAAPIRNKEGEVIGAVLVFNDVTESRALAQQITWQASHDALTGLANRREFERKLALLLNSEINQEKQHVLLYLDLDQFKVVNDTCGHNAGDELLRQLTALLADKVRDNDTLARLGGDEFGVLLEGCPVEQGTRIAEEMRKTIAGFKFAWESKLFDVGVSIGLVPINAQSESMAAVLSAADAACYAAKDDGRNRVQIFHGEEKSGRRQGEMQWVLHINKALEENRFVLFFQEIRPVAASSHGRHFEILVRMRDENGALVPPMAFIPAAERYGLMPAIDKWVVCNTFDWLVARGLKDEETEVSCAINLSGQSIGNDAFLEFMLEQLATRPLPQGCVCFEITETAAIANLHKARRFISSLREKGCSFALDDFGSGMSSYAYLKNLEVDYLKIDGVFVKDMVSDAVDYAMVESINRIGHVMGLKTIAEFVENDAILEKLRELGVDYAQGYGIHKPEPLQNYV